MIYHSNQVIFCSGKRRAGKSYFIINTFYNNLDRVIIYDRKFEHKNLEGKIVHNQTQLESAWAKGNHKIIFQPWNPSIEIFDNLCRWIFETGNKVLIVDEAASICTKAIIPFYYSELIRLGSIRGIGVISVSQRPREIYNTIISEADYIISFKLQLETDREKIAKTVGPEAFKLGEIENYYFMVYDGIIGEVQWHDPIQ